MKKEGECPKCKGRKLWIVDRMRIHVPSQMIQADMPVALKKAFWSGGKGVGNLQLYACAGCGFSELYALGLDDLVADPDMGVHFVDGEPQAGREGPMR